MTGPEAVACLTTWGAVGVLLLGLGTLRAALRARRRPPARRNYDVLAPPRPLTGAQRTAAAQAAHEATVQGIWAPNPMRDTLIVARPLGWDAQPRKEYEL